MSRATRTFFNFGYVLVLAVLAGNGVVTILNLRTIRDGDRWIDHTREVIIELERALSTLKDAETGQRGYLLTGDDAYLEPFRAASGRMDGVLDRLAALTADNPSQQARIAEARRLQAEKMEELRQTIALRGSGGLEAALAVVRTHRGKRLMDRAREVVIEMAEEEDRLLQQRRAWSQAATRRTVATFTVATVMVVVLLAFVYYLKRREDIEQERSAEAVRRGEALHRATLEALRASEERLRLIVESAADYAIFSLDLEGRVVTWNAGARHLTGYDTPEMIGRPVRTLYIREDLERRIPEWEMEQARERGRAENERWHVRKDGSLFWASGLLMPMRDGDRIIGWLKIMRDTTEQKRVEQELEVSRERLDLVVNSSEVGLWYCDLPFDKLIWNAKCKEHFGLKPDAEVTIEAFYDRLHPDDREPTRRAIERAVDGHGDYDAEFRTIDHAGRTRWIRAIGRAFYNTAGTPMRFDGITVDVTLRVQQEHSLREADRRKGEFLATLAHELRNPLAPIRNALRLMREPGAPGEGFAEERAMAERQVVHLARLVDDLMDVARISRGKIELRREMVDLSTIVGQAVQTARPLIEERRHRLAVSLPREPIRLEGDPTRLEQVLWNLLNNAAKYTEPGGEIALTAAREGGEAVIRVRDTGLGIPGESLPHIFGMFVQVEGHARRSQGGLGIGLGLVRSLVELHGGTIEAASEGPSRGSEFVVRLPLAPAGATVTPKLRPDHNGVGPDEADLPRRRVLVVDDNADAATTLARLLTRLHGQEVRVAHDGPEALRIAGEFHPEIVFLDIGLPGIDGYEVARRLRMMPEAQAARIVALTGWGQDADRQRSIEAGIDRHMVKPVDPEALPGLLRPEDGSPGARLAEDWFGSL